MLPVLQVVSKLSFIPTEKARIEVCKAEARKLDDTVRVGSPWQAACLVGLSCVAVSVEANV